jgi:hypothetical protein
MLQNHFRKFAAKFSKYDQVSGQVEPRRIAANIAELPDTTMRGQVRNLLPARQRPT